MFTEQIRFWRSPLKTVPLCGACTLYARIASVSSRGKPEDAGRDKPYRRELKDTCVVAQADAWKAGRWQASPLPSNSPGKPDDARVGATLAIALPSRHALTFALIGQARPLLSGAGLLWCRWQAKPGAVPNAKVQLHYCILRVIPVPPRRTGLPLLHHAPLAFPGFPALCLC
jgi:hypothetical protein